MSVCQSTSPFRNFLAEINRPLQENFEARFLGGVVKDCCRYFLIIKCEAGGSHIFIFRTREIKNRYAFAYRFLISGAEERT